MKLTTPFAILNRKFCQMNLIRYALKSQEKFATERLHDDYRKIFNSDHCIFYYDEECPTISNGYF